MRCGGVQKRSVSLKCGPIGGGVLLTLLALAPLLGGCGNKDARTRAPDDNAGRSVPAGDRSSSSKRTSDGSNDGTPRATEGRIVTSLERLPECDATTEGVLSYVMSERRFYLCEAGGRIVVDPLRGESGDPGAPGRDGTDGRDGSAGRDGTDGRDGASGRDGRGSVLLPLTLLGASHLTSASSNRNTTNGFTTGTNAVSPTPLVSTVDAFDTGTGEDFVAPTTYAEGVLGIGSAFGCVRFDLGPAIAPATVFQGTVLAKIGLVAAGGTSSVTVRFESSLSGVGGTFLLGPNTTASATSSERIFYPLATVAGRYVSLCAQGNSTRNVTVRIYQLFAWR